MATHVICPRCKTAVNRTEGDIVSFHFDPQELSKSNPEYCLGSGVAVVAPENEEVRDEHPVLG